MGPFYDFSVWQKDSNYTPVRLPCWLCWSGSVFSFPGYQLLSSLLLWCSGLLANEKGFPQAIEYSHSQRPDNSTRPFLCVLFFFFLSVSNLKYQICQICDAIQMNHWSKGDILMGLSLKCPKWSLKLQPRPAKWFNSVLANQYLCMKFLKVIRT